MTGQAQTLQEFIAQTGFTEQVNIHSDAGGKEVTRKQIYSQFPQDVQRRNYEEGMHDAGWNGWLEAPGVGAIAFVSRNQDGSDGELVFNW